MAAHPVLHPSTEVLKAFGLGKLNDSSSSAVMDHLEQCEQCRVQVAALSGDDFLNRLRQARSHSSTSTPAGALSDTATGAKPAAKPTPIRDLPPELANSSQYEIVRELGRGGMGVVYLAKNKLMDRLEVLKVVNKTLIDHPAALERFLREIRSAAKLSHNNVVTAYSAVQQGELLAFAMEYVEGQDLASLVRSQGPLPVPHACFYVQQAALGLQHAFDKQMVHRDIKPQNLILAREGKKLIVKVLDFGLAKVMREKKDDTGLTGEGRMLGTPDYIAPEQALDAAKADIRADIYSLGCTLYYLLSGHPPFSASSLGAVLMAHQMQEAKPLNLERPEVPEELAAVVRKMMAKSPAKRYQKPVEVVQALAPFVKQGATPKSPPELSSGASKAAAAQPAKVEAPSVAITAAKQPESPPSATWETLTEGNVTSVQPRRSGAVGKRQPASKMTETRKKWLIGGGIGVGVLLLALLGMWASGVFKVKTKQVILVVKVNVPNPDVFVNGEKVTVSWDNGGKQAEISVKPGTHKIEVKKDGFSAESEKLTFKDGERAIFTARLLPKTDNHGQQPAKVDPPPPDKPPPPPDTKKADAPRVASAADDNIGFVPLFNGKDLTGWSIDGGPPGQWVVEGNTIVGQSKDFKTRNYLLTEKEYTDFALHFEYKVEDGSHGGIAIRAIEGEKVPLNNNLIFDHPLIKLTNPAMDRKEPTGMTHWLKNAAGYWGPVEIHTLPTGIWHSMEVIVRAGTCTATVDDGKKLVNLTLDSSPPNNGAFIPGLGRRKGKVGFQINTGILRFRKIEIKELPAVKAEPPKALTAAAPPSPRRAEDKSAEKGNKQNAADPPAPRRAESNLPPEAKKAAEAFEKARDEARTKFLEEFDKVLDRLAKVKGSPEQRLKWINVVKEEKKRLEDKGLIPFSEPMRPYLAKYIVASKAAWENLSRVYASLIDAQLRAKNESMVAELKADLENLGGSRQVVAKWRHYVDEKLHRTVVLFSDGRGGGGPGSRWSFENGVLYYKLPNSTIPGGFGIDKLQVSPDGLSYSGFFDTGKREKKTIKVTGTYLKPD